MLMTESKHTGLFLTKNIIKKGGFFGQKLNKKEEFLFRMIQDVYSFSSLIVILPFLAVLTTFRALFITPVPNLDNSLAEMVTSLDLADFEAFRFMS